MNEIVLKKWYGRYGNNLTQLVNLCFYAFVVNQTSSVCIPKHDWLTATVIKNIGIENCISKERISHWDQNYFYGFESLTWYGKKTMLHRYIWDILIPEITKGYPPIDCAVHLRSGDVADESWLGALSKFYKRKSLKYYTTIINMLLEQNKIIYIVYEDNVLDVFNPLCELYKNNNSVVFQTSTPLIDFITLTTAEHFVFSRGTFGLMAYCLSKTMKYFYFSKNEQTDILLNLGQDPNVSFIPISE